MLRAFLIVLGVSVAWAQDGAAIYKARCAQCHDSPAGRVPPFSALRDMNSGQACARGVHQLPGAQSSASPGECVLLYVNSGYGQWGGMPGNLLLTFSVGGR